MNYVHAFRKCFVAVCDVVVLVTVPEVLVAVTDVLVFVCDVLVPV